MVIYDGMKKKHLKQQILDLKRTFASHNWIMNPQVWQGRDQLDKFEQSISQINAKFC